MKTDFPTGDRPALRQSRACRKRAEGHATEKRRTRTCAAIATKRSRAAGLSRHVSARPSATRWKPWRSSLPSHYISAGSPDAAAHPIIISATVVQPSRMVAHCARHRCRCRHVAAAPDTAQTRAQRSNCCGASGKECSTGRIIKAAALRTLHTCSTQHAVGRALRQARLLHLAPGHEARICHAREQRQQQPLRGRRLHGQQERLLDQLVVEEGHRQLAQAALGLRLVRARHVLLQWTQACASCSPQATTPWDVQRALLAFQVAILLDACMPCGYAPASGYAKSALDRTAHSSRAQA